MTQSTNQRFAGKRIIGTFVKQEWVSRRSFATNNVDVIDFDATDAVLLLPHSELIALKDEDDTASSMGKNCVQWDGPFCVHVTESILEFFDVDSLSNVTQEALANARDFVNPQPAQERTLTLTIKVNVRIANGVNLNDFIENLDYSIVSNTAGAVVTGTEIIDSEDLAGSN